MRHSMYLQFYCGKVLIVNLPRKTGAPSALFPKDSGKILPKSFLLQKAIK